MSRPEAKKRKWWVIVFWIVVAMAVEAVIILWPLACVYSGKGPIEVWTAMDEEPIRAIIGGLIGGLVWGLDGGLGVGLGVGLGAFIGVPLGVFLMYRLKQLSRGGISTFQGFFTPWRLKTYSFWKAITFFSLIYVGIVLLFSLWFNASYMGGTDENPAFRIPGDGQASWGDFVYFSFVTITTLGYGDISPLHPFPKVLVVLETLMGVGWVVVYIGMMLQVASRTAERPRHPQSVKVIRPIKDTSRLRRWQGRRLKKGGM